MSSEGMRVLIFFLTSCGLGSFLNSCVLADPVATASTTAEGSSAHGAIDTDRFSTASLKLWRGKAGERSWWWQVEFANPRPVGAILQVVGDSTLVLQNAPRKYIWQSSMDGQTWSDLTETAVEDERRIFRIHRLSKMRTVRALRINIQSSAEGKSPVLREVVFAADRSANFSFPPWAVVLSTTGDRKLPGEGSTFVPLAQQCEGWSNLQAQNVWLGDFRADFLRIEPRPLCAFLSGNFIDWCQQDRTLWDGLEQVLKEGTLPIWASCGGAQGLAILAEYGTKNPWDCPHCRDPKSPQTPLYGHIGHTDKRPCGDYSACRFERGVYSILQLIDDPVFAGLPRDFPAVESHCGQIEWAPKGWQLIATAGKGTLTKTQCLRLKNRPIYAAQFHIENSGALVTSRTIMTNFLHIAQEWNARIVPPGERGAAQP
jgi:hypothetical protein